MSSYKKDDWEVVKDITYKVVEEIKGRGTSFDETLAKTLEVSGEYMVIYILIDQIYSQLYLSKFKQFCSNCIIIRSNYIIIFRIG